MKTITIEKKVVHTVLRRIFTGAKYGVAHFKTAEKAQAYIRKFSVDGEHSIIEKDGVYNGIIKIKTAEQFHAA